MVDATTILQNVAVADNVHTFSMCVIRKCY